VITPDTAESLLEGPDEPRNVTSQNAKLPGIDELLADVLSDPSNRISTAKAILIALKNKAVKGDIKAAKVLLDRAYGKEVKADEALV